LYTPGKNSCSLYWFSLALEHKTHIFF
jgi:hypothetical protein